VAIITISRGSLSGGKALAGCLADRLGYPILGREVLLEAAESMGVSEEVFREKFEAAPGLWARLTREREKYTLAVQTSLAEWCTRGDLVYHGLSGQFLLKELPGVLKVRLVAPLDVRVKAFMDTHPLVSHAETESFIRNIDQERSRWCRLMYDAELTDPSHYDMTVNLKRLSLESACAVVAEAVDQPRYRITAEVETELFAFAARCRERLSQVTGG
jgi:cytidylate kinase